MFGLGNITKSVNLSLSQNNGLGKPTVKFEFEDNNSLFDFFVKTNKAGTEYAQNVDFEDVQDFEKTNNKKKNITTSSPLYLPNSNDKEDNTKTTNPKSLPPSGPNKKKDKKTSQKALPPSGLETNETFIPFGYEKITDEKVIQRFNENRNILNNSGLILVNDIISVIEKKPSVIFTTAGTDGIKKYKFKEKEEGEFVFEAVNDNGVPITGEINLKFNHDGIERLNALKSWFINPESTSKTSDVKTETTTSFETTGLSGNMFAVFNCPVSDLKCLGFSPTYKKLSSYDSLVDTPQGGKTLMGYGFESATLNELNNACKYYKQVEKLAQHLKGDSPLQSAFNVWYFLHENIIYNYDTEGQEEIRTPARSWADRLTGIDCDCLAVLTACLLFNMGYKPKFEIVGFNNNNCYSHIFVNLDGLAIDRVLPTFLKRPDGITNTKIMEIPVFELNGGDELINDCLLNGIYQSTLKKVVDNANSNDIINLRKIELLNNLQNSDTNAFKLASILMPYVSLIDDDGNFYFTDSVIADSAELADNRLYELYTSGASDSEKENFLKQFVSAFREIHIEVESGNKPFVNVKIQNVFSKPFTVEGNMIEKKLITLNPNFNRIKEAILFLLSVNYADLAKKIAVGLLPLDRVIENGYNEEKWENAKIANAKLFEFWRLLGGDTALLIDNIKDGYYNNLSGCKTLSGVDSIDETITTDIAVERIGNFLTVILDWYKDIEPLNIIQNNDNHIVNSVSADSNSLEDNSLLSSKAFIAEQPKISVNNPGLWIVAAAALGLSAVALSKNKK